MEDSTEHSTSSTADASRPVGLSIPDPHTAQCRSWDAHLAKEPSGREENEPAASETVRLQGHIVEVLSTHDASGGKSVKTWRYRLVREEDGAIIFDCGKFGPKAAYRNMIKKAINAQYDIIQMVREKATKA